MAGTRVDCAGIREEERSSREEPGETRMNLSVISLAIARSASNPPGVSSMDSMELIRELDKGVLLDGDQKKFWIDERLHKNCFMVLAKGLSITWIGEERYWSWIPDQEDSLGGKVDVEAAKLNHVWWLEMSGKFPSSMLSPMTTYEVVFVLKLTKECDGWHSPVNLGLSLPDGTSQNRVEDLAKKPKERWLEVPVGDFMANPEIVGYISFSLNEYSGHQKRGLVVKGVIFRPKY